MKWLYWSQRTVVRTAVNHSVESECSLNLSSVSSFTSSTGQHCNKAPCYTIRPLLGCLPIIVQSLYSRSSKKGGQNYNTREKDVLLKGIEMGQKRKMHAFENHRNIHACAHVHTHNSILWAMHLLWEEEEITIKSGDRNFYLLLDLFLEIKDGMLLDTKNKRNQYTKQHLKLD